MRGKTIQRYATTWKGDEWLITTHNGYAAIPAIDVFQYPAVQRHLDRFYQKLANRQDKGVTPYNLRSCAYHAKFEKEKLVWIQLVNDGRFSYDDLGRFSLDSTCIMTGIGIKYLCSILNSRLVDWYFHQIGPTSGTGTKQWKKTYVEKIPIPHLHPKQISIYDELMDSILHSRNSKNLVDLIEQEIDNLIFSLFDLKQDEISTIMNSPKE